MIYFPSCTPVSMAVLGFNKMRFAALTSMFRYMS